MNTHLYRAFGAWIESVVELPWLAGTARPVGFAPADVRLRMDEAAPMLLALLAREPVYRSQTAMPNSAPFLRVYRLDAGDVLRFHDDICFRVRDDEIEIALPDMAQAQQAQVWLLGPVLAFWHERRGALALHASAIVTNGVAVAFTANSRAGKSTLAASFVQAGAALLSDDIVPCEVAGATVIAQPGFPSMRMWPAEAGHFIGDFSQLDFVHPAIDKRRAEVGEAFGSFYDTPASLACIYLPERYDDDGGLLRIEIAPLSRSEALVELARLSFVARLMQSLRPPAARFELLTRIARAVPVKRLRYPSGYAHLPAVRAAVMKDMA